jgi:polyisoprenoid-binding protein YceI
MFDVYTSKKNMQSTFSKIILSALILVSGASVSFAGGNDNAYKVVSEKSEVKWTAKKVTGEHSGFVKIKEGSLEVQGKQIKGGKFDIDLTTMNVDDLKDPEYNGKLLGHLKSDDFFSVAKFPNAALELKSAKNLGEDKYELSGNLTIKGITKPITFPATVKVTDKNIVAVAQITVDRTLYDIKYGSASFFEGLGDKAIDNNFTLDVKLSAQK